MLYQILDDGRGASIWLEIFPKVPVIRGGYPAQTTRLLSPAVSVMRRIEALDTMEEEL